ncbi:5-(carboxyamino)imidazole ribonucleotide synthase [Candidatus Nanopelagicales bacterium]|nr:5-(carboxyamino)imidazole ribonucleotide synthase [Candidatus Nanopelagicales bacterium]
MTSSDRPRVGMVGGGQLARMSAAPAAALGIDFRVLATSPDESAAQVVSDVALGAHDDEHAVLAFAEGCDVVTFDHEHVPPPILEKLEARGVAVRPGPHALINAQDKAIMRRTLEGAGAPVPAWRVVESAGAAEEFAAEVGYPFILKTTRGGYDGKGVWRIPDVAELERVMGVALPPGAQWLAEAAVPFVQELSAQVARSPSGQTVAYPVVRTVQADGICSEVVAPAPGLDPERAVDAQKVALDIAGALNVTGMLAVEMFDTGDQLLVNELAMRPHNSGHWSIDGAVTSQFENHLRAVLDLPLGSPVMRAPHAVMVNILGGDVGDLHSAYRHVFARDPGLKVHLYGKDVRPGRKVGHVTAVGDDVETLLARARHAADYFSGAIDE